MSDEPEELEEEADNADEPDERAQADAADAAEPAKAAKKAKPPKPPKGKKAKTKGFNRLLLLIPVAVVAALAGIFTLPPTRAMLANGPLKPLFARLRHTPPVAAVATAPKNPADRPAPADREPLNDALQTDRNNAAAKDAQITRLQKQVSQLQAQPKSMPAPPAKPTPAAISEGVKRAAMYWAGMDADKAADIAKQLPDTYVKLVFSQMPPDAVSDIMSALPTKTAARLMPSGDPQPP